MRSRARIVATRYAFFRLKWIRWVTELTAMSKTKILGHFDMIWGSSQACLAEEGEKISGHMQPSQYHGIPAHTSRQWCQTIEGSLAVPWPVSNRLSIFSTTVYSQSEKVCDLVQSSALDLSLRGWPEEAVNWRRTTKLVLKGPQPLCILVAMEGPLKCAPSSLTQICVIGT